MTTRKWFRLDNSAKLFPFLTTKDTQNLFRFTIDLSDDIDSHKLELALNKTLVRFPSFAVRLRRGIFWYYLEKNEKPAKVYPESDIIMAQITPHNCNGYSFRTMYYKNRLTLEFFHLLCDGSGAMQFIKCLLYTYLTDMGKKVDSENKVLTIDSPIDSREVEDSFAVNYKPIKLKDLDISGMTGSKNEAFKLTGEQFDYLGKGAITADLKVKEILSYCKSKGYTLTQFLGGLFMYSVYMTKGKKVKNPNDITLFIPMNLRKIYDSITLRNFTLFSRVRANIKKDDIPIEEFIGIIKDSVTQCSTKEYLDGNISTAMMGEKFWLMRILPLWIKHLVFAINNVKTLKKPTKTATFSNIGVVDLPESFKPFVKKITFMLHACPSVPISFTAITTYDTLTLSFVRLVKDTEVEEFFIGYLADLGFDITVSSNYWEVDNAL